MGNDFVGEINPEAPRWVKLKFPDVKKVEVVAYLVNTIFSNFKGAMEFRRLINTYMEGIEVTWYSSKEGEHTIQMGSETFETFYYLATGQDVPVKEKQGTLTE